MRNKASYIVALCLTSCAMVAHRPAAASDWIVAPSTYTHDPMTGQRVDQYTPIGPFYVYQRPDFSSSGFRHTRSTIRYNGAADNYYKVDEWGNSVRPFGEWLRPYRPYSVPYQLWGPPFAGMYQPIPWSFGGHGGYGGGRPGYPGTGHPGPGRPGPGGPGPRVP